MTLTDDDIRYDESGGRVAQPSSAGTLPAELVEFLRAGITTLDVARAAGSVAGSRGDVEDGEWTDDDWDDESRGTSYARCSDGRGTLTHLFFSDDDFDIARAKAICGKCGLAAGCLAGALERAEAFGVWGGELIEDGVVVAVKRRRGRPPKHPRPALVVDEVPVPPHLVA